jgi:hypothetical protein
MIFVLSTTLFGGPFNQLRSLIVPVKAMFRDWFRSGRSIDSALLPSTRSERLLLPARPLSTSLRPVTQTSGSACVPFPRGSNFGRNVRLAHEPDDWLGLLYQTEFWMLMVTCNCACSARTSGEA